MRIFFVLKLTLFYELTSADFQVAMAKVMEQGPVLVLTFMVQQIMILRDAVGNVVEGGEVSTFCAELHGTTFLHAKSLRHDGGPFTRARVCRKDVVG